MASTRALTGGTRDVNPQYMTLSMTQAAADTTTGKSFPIPVQRLSSGRGRAMVMEVLKVYFDFTSLTDGADATLRFYLSTRSPIAGAPSLGGDSSIFAGLGWISRVNLNGDGRGLMAMPTTQVLDLTDGAGHGLLIATDNIFMTVYSTNTGVANEVGCKILYRWKNVSVEEYIGIVQSQTQSAASS